MDDSEKRIAELDRKTRILNILTVVQSCVAVCTLVFLALWITEVI